METATIQPIGRVRLQVINGITKLDRLKIKYLSNGTFRSKLLRLFPAKYDVLQDTGFQTNLITNVGKAAMAGLLGNVGSVTAPTYLALGTSATGALVTDTTLGAEITDTGLARTTAVVTRTTTAVGVTNDTTTYTYTWTASGVKTIAEIGLFNASSAGTLVGHRILTSTITTANGNAILATYNVQFT